MLSIIITRAQTDEATTLKQIAIAAKRYWNYPDHLIAQWAATPIIDPAAIGRDLVFVARIDDRPVGWYRLMVDRLPAILEDLWVTPEWIGQGLGRALLNHATIECRKRGTIADDHLRAGRSSAGGRRALRFLQRHGRGGRRGQGSAQGFRFDLRPGHAGRARIFPGGAGLTRS